jgi:hypothetical protein
MLRILLFGVTCVAGLVVIVYNIVKFLLAINKGKSRLYKEINKIRNEVQPDQFDLVPIDQGELSTLSHNTVAPSKLKVQQTNVMTSIFNEPFVAYQSKYIDGKEKAVLVAYTSNHEFSYIFNKGIVDIFINEQPYARMFKDGKIKNLSGELIAYIESDPLKKEKRMIYKNKEMAIINSSTKNSMTEKAFQCLEAMNKEEEDIVLALCLPELVMR